MSMGIVLIGGLLSSLFLTLFLVPAMYVTTNRIAVGSTIGSRAARSAGAAPERTAAAVRRRSPRVPWATERPLLKSLRTGTGTFGSTLDGGPRTRCLIHSATLVALAAAAVLSGAAAPAAAAGPVSVQVNGTREPGPGADRARGRVFVPLRGVFENLGASVVYANGVINATGRGHNVSLRIGSQQRRSTASSRPSTSRRSSSALDLRPAALRLAGARRDGELRRQQPLRRDQPNGRRGHRAAESGSRRRRTRTAKAERSRSPRAPGRGACVSSRRPRSRRRSRADRRPELVSISLDGRRDDDSTVAARLHVRAALAAAGWPAHASA